MTDLGSVLSTIDTWGADHAAAVVLGPDGVLAGRGEPGHRFRWASLTKLATAWTVVIATERGLVDLDEPAGPPGATVRHLLAHASGLPFEGAVSLAKPGRRRIYSNPGYDALGELVGERTGRPFEEVLREFVLAPLRMDETKLLERPSQGLHGPDRRHGGAGRGAASAAAGRARDGPGGDDGRIPGPGRRRTRGRSIRSVRLGSRARAARRQGAALDGSTNSARRSDTSAAQGRSSGSIRWRTSGW
jgi:CubicO group peptidase (beta-lactamase class C family)